MISFRQAVHSFLLSQSTLREKILRQYDFAAILVDCLEALNDPMWRGGLGLDLAAELDGVERKGGDV
jgi:hypothetical protein